MSDSEHAQMDAGLHVAERAHAWLAKLPTATLEERAEFTRWLKASPLNVREVLLATMWELAFDYIEFDAAGEIPAPLPSSVATTRPPATKAT